MKIDFSVGDWRKGAKNRPNDVGCIQFLLTQVSILTKKKAFDPKGIDNKIAKPPKQSSTVKAIIAFQATIMTTPDGLIEPGKNTFKKLLSTLRKHQFPNKPYFLPLTGNSDRERVFGKFKYELKKDKKGSVIRGSDIILKDDWEKNNIITVHVPYLSSIPLSFGSSSTKRMRFHKSLADQLRSIWQTWYDAGLINRIHNYAGAYAPRLVRRSRTRLSSHAWGTAFDINSDTNGLGKIPPLLGDYGCVRELVQIANTFGFFWGGHFSYPDGMHFEAALIGASPSAIAMHRIKPAKRMVA